MKEVHEAWRISWIRDRLRVLMQRRASARRELQEIQTRQGLARKAGRPRADEPREPSQEETRAQADRLEELLAGPVWGSDSPSQMPLGDLVDALEKATGWTGPVEDGPHSLLEAGEPPPQAILTARRRVKPPPRTVAEAERRIVQLGEEIADLERRIGDVNRVLARRAQGEGLKKLERIRMVLEAQIPDRREAQRTFDVDLFLRANRALIQHARSLAVGCGRVFPDRECDFLALPRPMRERLLGRIGTM